MVQNLDLTAPVKKDDIVAVARSGSLTEKDNIVERILGYLNEKRDAYNGLSSSIIYMIDSGDEELVRLLNEGLIRLLASEPMRYGGKMFIARCLPRLVVDHPEFVADLFSTLMRASATWEPKFRDKSEILKVKITALRAIGQAEQRTRTKLTDIEQEIIDEICDDAILMADEATKVDTLYLLLDTKVTTKTIASRDLEIFMVVFRDALNFQVPALRQKFISITNKVMKRMADSIRVVMRDKQKFPDRESETITKRYTNFLSWLVQFCLDNIYCNKYFGSFTITMSTLHYIIEHISLNNPNLPIAHLFKSRRFYDSILSCVSLDSFEENKVMALKLLFALPNDEQYTFIRNLQSFENIAYELVSSVNPAHSLTCQYIFKLVIGFRQRQTSMRKNQLVYQHLDRLVGLVEVGVKETKENFIAALKSNAIYPKLTCIRALLSEIDMKDLKFDRDKWELLALRIVNASIEACQAISTTVCNMNPETIGHMPMDLKPIDAETLSRTYDVSVTISKDLLDTITSQHLLITGWKTIKECSLSMAAMCSHLWWPKNDKHHKGRQPILDSRAIKMIIRFFEHYLRNLRHRGAFEQAYNGFVLVTKRIWLEEEFRELLTTSLKEIMSDFASEQEKLGDKKVEYLKNHITRRSAGLPFLVQAIVVSEDKKESKMLHWAMNCLLDILEDSKAEVYQKIHCLNILKALMKDFNLGEKVVPFISRTMLITIESFRSDNFSIRNCANMLMRVIVDRTFGVNRLRDDVHKRNTLSFEKFFTEQPKIKPKLLHYLSEGLTDKNALASVHAVLIILNRLRPSINPSPDYSLEKVVRPFIQPVNQLAYTCPDYNLRELASKLCTQLETFHLQADVPSCGLVVNVQNSSSSVISILEADKIDCNHLHGYICMLRSWLDRCKTISHLDEVYTDLSRATESAVKSIVLANLDEKLGFASGTIKMISLDVAESFCLLYPTAEHSWLLDLYPYLKQQLQRAFLATDSDQYKFGPHFENLIFKIISALLTSGCVPGKDLKSFETEAIYEDLFELLIEIITKPPNRILGLNLQAALVRMIRQFFDRSEDFIDKLLDNLDLDSTAVLMTPIDKLVSKAEIDSEYERWSKFCERVNLSEYIRESIPNNLLNRLFDFYKYQEFEPLSSICHSTVASSNTPRSVELLAFACKGWIHYDLENRCVWLDSEDATSNKKLTALTRFISILPECDLKCLALMCASHLFNAELVRCYEQSKLGLAFSDQQVAMEYRTNSLREFTNLLETLADGDRCRITRETCIEVLKTSIKLAIDCWSSSLRGASMDLFSTLIKLCQDEDFDIRQCSSGVLASLNKEQHRSSIKLESLIRLISTKLLDPANELDVIEYFNLMTRIIFNHSKNYSINFTDDKESLFDKTKPNVFADHVATIQSTLDVAKEFFQRLNACRGTKISINALRLSPEVVAEMEILDIKNDGTKQIGDYSWRLKGLASIDSVNKQMVDNRTLVERSLVNIRLSLDYFDYRNMLLDTTFGYHESTIFKRLAFVRLLIEATDYSNPQLISGIQRGIERVINESCATTILSKSRELLNR